MDKIPSGMTKDRYIEMRVQDALIEEEDFDLLVMGRPEGPGCYCYVNSLLRSTMDRITGSYDFVVMDNAAVWNIYPEGLRRNRPARARG